MFGILWKTPNFILFSVNYFSLYINWIKNLQTFIFNQKTMEEILNRLNQIEAKVHSLRKVCKLNNLSLNFLNGYNLKRMNDIYSRLVKHYQENPQKGKSIWFQSELKLFNWVLISYSLIFEKKIQNFNEQDWSFFKQIFFGKDVYTFKYESKKLLNKDVKNSRVWNSEEDEILTTIMENPTMKNKWNEIARLFYEMSDQKFFRTGKQCRQHWLNHLDSSKKHGKWNVLEDLIILKYVIVNGKKWSTISKEKLPHRTEHMIKNRFKSIMSKFQRELQNSQEDQNICIKKIINNLSKVCPQTINSEGIIMESENQENQMSDVIDSKQNEPEEFQVKKEEIVQEIPVVSENKQKVLRLQQSQKIQEQVSCVNTFPSTSTISSPVYSLSPPILGFYYQPSFLCFPFSSYWNICTPDQRPNVNSSQI